MATDDGPTVCGGPTGTQNESRAKPGLPWRRIARVGGGVIVTAAVATLATLALTHNRAVSENFAAYSNGINDALEAVRNGFDPFGV